MTTVKRNSRPTTIPTVIAILAPFERLLPVTCLTCGYGIVEAATFCVHNDEVILSRCADVTFQLSSITQFNFDARFWPGAEFTDALFHFLGKAGPRIFFRTSVGGNDPDDIKQQTNQHKR